MNQQYWQSKVDIALNGKQQGKTKNYRPMTYEAASSLKKKQQDPDTRSRHLNQPTVALVRKREKSATFHVFFVKSWPRHDAQRAKFAKKVHKPPLRANVINLGLNEFNASLWVPWIPSEPKKL